MQLPWSLAPNAVWERKLSRSTKRFVDYLGTSEIRVMIVLESTVAARTLSEEWEWIEATHGGKNIVRTPAQAAPSEISRVVLLAGFHIYSTLVVVKPQDTIATALRQIV